MAVLINVKHAWQEKCALRLVSIAAAHYALRNEGTLPDTPQFEGIDAFARSILTVALHELASRLPESVWARQL